MSRKAIVNVTVKMILILDEDVLLCDAVNEFDYEFTDTTGKVTIEDTEITGMEVIDSK